MTETFKVAYNPDFRSEKFSGRSLPVEIIDRLKSEVTFMNTHEAGLRLQAIFNHPEPFGGFLALFHGLRRVADYLAVVIDPNFPFAEERGAFCATQFMLCANKAGLATRIVTKGVSEADLKIGRKVYEKMIMLVAFGYPDTPLQLPPEVFVRRGDSVEKVTLALASVDSEVSVKASVENYHKSACNLGAVKARYAEMHPGVWEWGNDAPFLNY